MFERMARGWEMLKQSWQVLAHDKELMLFPILSSLACALVMASFVLPVVLSPTLRQAVLFEVEQAEADQAAIQRGGEEQAFEVDKEQVIVAALSFLFYLATTFVIVFFNTALVCCAMIRFSGGNPSLGDGLSAATERLPQILGWSLLTATVGTILRMVEERVPAVGKIVVSLIGLGWAVVTFLVVPILAAEKLGPFAAVKRSAGLLRRTWGEALVGHVSLGWIQFLFMLPMLAVVAGAVFLSANSETWWPLLIGGGIAVVYTVLLAIVFSTLQQIFLAAVYQYAAEGTVASGFSQDLIEATFRQKNR